MRGNGTTSSSHQYAFKDYHPIIGKNYYQLEQTDFDGHATTFETIVVDVLSLDRSATIYPNPISQDQLLNVVVDGLLAGSATEIEIVDMHGLKQRETIVNSDANGTLRASVALTGLSAGLYILKVQNANFKFIID